MFLGTRDKILARIQELVEACGQRRDLLRMAVAFWGSGSEQIIKGPGRFNILCNLSHPGTNPWVIEKIRNLPGVNIKQLDDLHAKVVIGSAGAFVGSANMSERALGINMSGRQGWLEAGVSLDAKTDDHAEASIWFDAAWEAAGAITDPDLERAKLTWAERGGEALEAFAGQASTYDQDASDPNLHRPPDLFEEHVFEDKAFTKKSANMTRMASRNLEQLYYQAFPGEERNRSTVKVPAHAANLLWTLSGQSVPTNISGLPEFTAPEMVIERAKHLKTFDRVHEFMAVLAQSPVVRPHPAVRYWARQYRPA